MEANMEPKKYCMVKDNLVYNVCMWNGDTNTWKPPDDGTLMIQNDCACIGDWYEQSESRFYRPIPNNNEALIQDGEQTSNEQ
jgi:hypothetical protein